MVYYPPMKVGLVYDPIYLEHDTGTHPENPRRLKAIMQLLEKEGILSRLTMLSPRKATTDELALVHAREHIQHVEAVAAAGDGWLDPDTPVSPRSYEVALYAAGGVLRGLDAVMSKEVDAAFCLVRPPGHHASFWHAAGFCLFNNLAIAAKYALAHFVRRVLIVDFDVHHGNGTQDLFYTEPNVLYFSTHQVPLYPGTGSIYERGAREGEGASVNVPLPPGCGDAEYLQAFQEVLLPAAKRFVPELVLVSAGYDGHWRDSIASMALSVTGFARMTKMLKEMAQDMCQGRLLFTLEGGYDLDALASSVGATLRVLLGDSEVPDPLGPPPKYHPPSISPLLGIIKEKNGL